jgi:hypothetical protein
VTKKIMLAIPVHGSCCLVELDGSAGGTAECAGGVVVGGERPDREDSDFEAASHIPDDTDADRPDAALARRRRPVNEPLKVRFEIVAVDGPAGKELARRQAAVMRDVLGWLRDHPTEPAPTDAGDAGEPPGDSGR